MNLKFSKLTADDIDVRVATVTEKGCSLLLYKNARVDMQMLDDTVGPMNWKREHTRDNRNCIVSIWDSEKSQWISKEDTGTESNTEAEKGLASDSFKRACFNWGIGRELYTAPFIWITDCRIVKNERGKLQVKDRFSVAAIDYEGSRISRLAIVNGDGKPVFRWGLKISGDTSNQLIGWLQSQGVKAQTIMSLYKVRSLMDLTVTQYNDIRDNINRIREVQDAGGESKAD